MAIALDPSALVARPPRVPRPLSRRIDRLASAAHRFHQFAHHPLCDRYAGEVVRIGRRARLCRGCLAGAAGAIVGLAIGFAVGSSVQPLLVAIVATAVAAFAMAALKLRIRRGKISTRAIPGATAGFALAAGIAGGGPLGAALAAGTALAIGGAVAMYRHRGPDRSPCGSCPERTASPCSGLSPIVLRERAFRRVAGRWLRASTA